MLTPARIAWCVALTTGLSACAHLDDPRDPALTQPTRITAAPDSIPADGVSRAAIALTPVNGTPVGTSLTVATDLGTLSGAGQSGQQVTINVGTEPIVLALTSGTAPGVATVSVKTSASFVSDTVRFFAATPSVLQLTADVGSAKPNGQDAVHVTAHLFRDPGSGVPSTGTRVRFDVIRDGVAVPELSNRVVQTDSTGAASYTITARTAGAYVVTASAAGKSDSITITFAG